MSGVVAQVRVNGLVMRIAAIAAIGGFLFGYDTGVISGAVLYIKEDFSIGPTPQEFVVFAILVGAIAGGRAVGVSRRPDQPHVHQGALRLGVRGRCALTSGIFLSYVVDWGLKDVADNWRWMLGIAVLPGAALAVGMLTSPKTPRWLMEHGRDQEARDVLGRLRQGAPDTDLDAEFEGVRRAADEARRASLGDLLRLRLRPLLVIGLGLALFQQFVGVNTVIYYAPTILQQTGLGAGSAITQALAVGATNVVFTVVAVLLLDRVGRRPLLLTGTAVLTASLALLAVYFASDSLQRSAPWLALIAPVTYIAGFALKVPETGGRTLEDLQVELVPQDGRQRRTQAARRDS